MVAAVHLNLIRRDNYDHLSTGIFKQIYGYIFPEGANETDVLINSYFDEKLKLHTDLHTEDAGA